MVNPTELRVHHPPCGPVCEGRRVATPADLISAVRRGVESGTIKGEVVAWCSEHGAAMRRTYLCDWSWLNRHDAQEACRRVRSLVIPVSDGGSET